MAMLNVFRVFSACHSSHHFIDEPADIADVMLVEPEQRFRIDADAERLAHSLWWLRGHWSPPVRVEVVQEACSHSIAHTHAVR